MADQLTNLDSYDEFLPKLKNAMANIGDSVIAIVYTDIKHFKYFNDTYGYKRGNKLLARMAELVAEKNSIFLCGSRVVSDNIVVAGRVNERTPEDIRNEVESATIYLQSVLRKEFSCNRIRLAVGVFCISKENADIDPETAVSNANLARKQAKEHGNKTVVLFNNDMAESINREIEIIGSIEDAVEKHELQAFYQPKIDSRTGRIVGAEALVRWQKSDGKFIYPDQFIPVIEKSGHIVDVDYYIYNEVFMFLRERINSGKPVTPISMNVSRLHLRDMGIINYIKGLFAKYNIDPKLLELELTETVCMEDTDKVMRFIDECHRLGMLVSMDDFGSGYSSLNLLSEIPIDVIKLDRCFLRTGEITEKQKIILTSIINMANQLKMTSLCEGVETMVQSEFLAEIGCDIQQGYYFSKPVPRDAFEKALEGV